jgi:quaternary ammonium compound-resistance protein SugE
MNWVILIGAGLVEVAMALSLKESHGFSRLGPSALFTVFAVVSFGMLSYALRSLPVGTAYAVWTGIGAAGTAILGIVFLGEPRDAIRLVSIALIIAGVVGLRLAGNAAA